MGNLADSAGVYSSIKTGIIFQKKYNNHQCSSPKIPYANFFFQKALWFWYWFHPILNCICSNRILLEKCIVYHIIKFQIPWILLFSKIKSDTCKSDSCITYLSISHSLVYNHYQYILFKIGHSYNE